MLSFIEYLLLGFIILVAYEADTYNFAAITLASISLWLLTGANSYREGMVDGLYDNAKLLDKADEIKKKLNEALSKMTKDGQQD